MFVLASAEAGGCPYQAVLAQDFLVHDPELEPGDWRFWALAVLIMLDDVYSSSAVPNHCHRRS